MRERSHARINAMVYRYFYDCEFIEDGRSIDLVSIGVVDEHGREFYAISTEFDARAAVPWVRRNVLDRLPSPGDPAWRSRARIREDLLTFLVAPLGRGDRMELWAWYAAYDHVVLAQLWGPMPRCRANSRFTGTCASSGTAGPSPLPVRRSSATMPSSTRGTIWPAGTCWSAPPVSDDAL
jgi:hypothetical protein